MTLTCQVEVDVFHFVGDSVVHTMELNWGKSVNHTPAPSRCLRMLSTKQMCVSTSIFGSTVTTYLNFLHFRPEKGVSGPLRPKGPELGMVITTL